MPAQKIPITNANWQVADWNTMTDEEYRARVKYWAENVSYQFNVTEPEVDQIMLFCRNRHIGFWDGLDHIRGINSRQIAREP